MYANLSKVYRHFASVQVGDIVLPSTVTGLAGVDRPSQYIWYLREKLNVDIATLKDGKSVTGYKLSSAMPTTVHPDVLKQEAKMNGEKIKRAPKVAKQDTPVTVAADVPQVTLYDSPAPATVVATKATPVRGPGGRFVKKEKVATPFDASSAYAVDQDFDKTSIQEIVGSDVGKLTDLLA